MKHIFNKICDFTKSIDLATLSLIIIGIICLLETIITIFLDMDQISPNDIAIRSIMSSIFGFVFGSQLSENSNIKNKNL